MAACTGSPRLHSHTAAVNPVPHSTRSAGQHRYPLSLLLGFLEVCFLLVSSPTAIFCSVDPHFLYCPLVQALSTPDAPPVSQRQSPPPVNCLCTTTASVAVAVAVTRLQSCLLFFLTQDTSGPSSDIDTETTPTAVGANCTTWANCGVQRTVSDAIHSLTAPGRELWHPFEGLIPTPRPNPSLATQNRTVSSPGGRRRVNVWARRLPPMSAARKERQEKQGHLKSRTASRAARHRQSAHRRLCPLLP